MVRNEKIIQFIKFKLLGVQFYYTFWRSYSNTDILISISHLLNWLIFIYFCTSLTLYSYDILLLWGTVSITKNYNFHLSLYFCLLHLNFASLPGLHASPYNKKVQVWPCIWLFFCLLSMYSWSDYHHCVYFVQLIKYIDQINPVFNFFIVVVNESRCFVDTHFVEVTYNKYTLDYNVLLAY